MENNHEIGKVEFDCSEFDYNTYYTFLFPKGYPRMRSVRHQKTNAYWNDEIDKITGELVTIDFRKLPENIYKIPATYWLEDYHPLEANDNTEYKFSIHWPEDQNYYINVFVERLFSFLIDGKDEVEVIKFLDYQFENFRGNKAECFIIHIQELEATLEPRISSMFGGDSVGIRITGYTVIRIKKIKTILNEWLIDNISKWGVSSERNNTVLTAAQYILIEYFTDGELKEQPDPRIDKAVRHRELATKYCKSTEDFKKAFQRLIPILEGRLPDGKKQPFINDLIKVKDYFNEKGQFELAKKVELELDSPRLN